MNSPYTLHLGDCLETLRGMPDNSVDSIVTDPPYGLSFMGKKWDYDVPGVDVWTECLRVLKPGGHLLAFAGTRTQHRMAVRIEDAGFDIRDMIAWVYGSGFPKSRNIANDMDGEDGAEWQGWGTALKPALEPITVARKPLVGTVAGNVLEWGTGALNIDGCRVEGVKGVPASPCRTDSAIYGSGASLTKGGTAGFDPNAGRWPANLIHDGSAEVVALFPQSNAGKPSDAPRGKRPRGMGEIGERKGDPVPNGPQYGDTGSAARFFYCAKASRADRNAGLDSSSTPAVTADATMRDCQTADWSTRNGNSHPTVKPTDLMAYLVRMVTPPAGVVLDPFMGSGSTGKAAMREGFGFIGCELSPEYMAIARARIEHELAVLQAASQPAPQFDLFGT